MTKSLTLDVHSEPIAATLITVSGELLTDERRRQLRERFDAGGLAEIEFDAIVFRDVPNTNHFRFRGADLGAFGASFAGQPFLRDHDTRHIESRDGTILDSAHVDGAFVQTIRLTTRRGMRSFLEGQIDRFSIGWYYEGITCSICEQDWLGPGCHHWPGRTYTDGKGENPRTCELIFEHPRGKETSAVNAPAVPGTTILAQLCEHKEQLIMTKPILAAGDQDEAPATPVDPEPVAAAVPAATEEGARPAPTEQAPAPDPQPPAPDPSAGAGQRLTEWVAYLQDQALDSALRESGLPATLRQAIRSEFAGKQPTPADLQAAIARQRALWAQLQQDQVVTGVDRPLDGGRVSGMATSLDKVTAALEALIEGRQPALGARPLSGIREAYVLLSGDYEMRGIFDPENVGLAAVDSSTMAGLVANALNKIVVNQFQQYPRWWEPLVFVEDFTTLQTIRWITLGGVGELPTVPEGKAYTEMTWDDQTETSAWTKKGGYLGLTLEAIDRDDTRRIQQAPRALAQAAWLALSRAIAAIFTSGAGVGPTMSDGVALFHANHNNLGSTALSFAGWDATRVAMRKQTELNSGERLGGLVVPKFLLVPPDLETTGLQVLASAGQPGTADNDENPFAEGDSREARLRAARSRLIVVDLWTDANNWAAVADPLLYPSIGLGYRFGRVPQIFSVASPNSGLMFTNDVMPIKVRFFFAVGPTDWRGLYKHNVA